MVLNTSDYSESSGSGENCPGGVFSKSIGKSEKAELLLTCGLFDEAAKIGGSVTDSRVESRLLLVKLVALHQSHSWDELRGVLPSTRAFALGLGQTAFLLWCLIVLDSGLLELATDTVGEYLQNIQHSADNRNLGEVSGVCCLYAVEILGNGWKRFNVANDWVKQTQLMSEEQKKVVLARLEELQSTVSSQDSMPQCNTEEDSTVDNTTNAGNPLGEMWKWTTERLRGCIDNASKQIGNGEIQSANVVETMALGVCGALALYTVYRRKDRIGRSIQQFYGRLTSSFGDVAQLALGMEGNTLPQHWARNFTR